MRFRRTAALGATTLVLAGSAVLGTPGVAVADTKTVPCGGSVTAKPGDQIKATTPLLGIPLDLGIVGEATQVLTGVVNGLLGTVCKVTVTVVNTVVAPVPVVGAPVAGAVNGTVDGVHGALTGANGNTPAPGTPPPNPQTPPGTPGGGHPQTGPGSPMPGSNSPVLNDLVPDFTGLPAGFAGGYAPMRDYRNIPMASPGLFAPSPGVRYGTDIPGYSPEFGILGREQSAPPDGVQNAGRADALPGGGSSGLGGQAGLPMLIAVLALSGVTAGLVRSWVLRRTV